MISSLMKRTISSLMKKMISSLMKKMISRRENPAKEISRKRRKSIQIIRQVQTTRKLRAEKKKMQMLRRAEKRTVIPAA